MVPSVRAGLFAALALVAFAAYADEKAFRRPNLDDSAIKLEAQIKIDAGAVTKPAAQLRTDAAAAFQKNDLRSGMMILGQVVAAEPNDAASWLRLARTVSQIRPRDDKERILFLDRAATAAYIAYQRATNKNDEADALALLGRMLADRQEWRPSLDAMRTALDIREVADLRGQYERLRVDHGFRMLDYSIDSDAISPRACFQFSENLPAKGVDFAPFVSLAGVDKPAISVSERQLCVEGLKHGERYAVTLRAGLPSTVRETLARTTELGIYVRDRKPFARFAGKSYVLPRTGQRGIPVLSVNTDAVAIDLYRVGDRNLIDTVLGEQFQRSLYRYQADQLGQERGAKVWSGELAVEQKLNTEVTTAFPVSYRAAAGRHLRHSRLQDRATADRAASANRPRPPTDVGDCHPQQRRLRKRRGGLGDRDQIRAAQGRRTARRRETDRLQEKRHARQPGGIRQKAPRGRRGKIPDRGRTLSLAGPSDVGQALRRLRPPSARQGMGGLGRRERI